MCALYGVRAALCSELWGIDFPGTAAKPGYMQLYNASVRAVKVRRAVVGLGTLQSLARFTTAFPDVLPRICVGLSATLTACTCRSLLKKSEEPDRMVE